MRPETATYPAEHRRPLQRLFEDNEDIRVYSGKVCEEPDVPPVGIHLVVGDDHKLLRPIQALHSSRLWISYNPVWEVIPAETRTIIGETNGSRRKELGHDHYRRGNAPSLCQQIFHIAYERKQTH